jgi:hypothetical protein
MVARDYNALQKNIEWGHRNFVPELARDGHFVAAITATKCIDHGACFKSRHGCKRFVRKAYSCRTPLIDASQIV